MSQAPASSEHRLWRLARRLLISVAILATCIAAFYTIERLRGERAWRAASAKLKAQGIELPAGPFVFPPPLDESPHVVALRNLFPADATERRWPNVQPAEITPAILEEHATHLTTLGETLKDPLARFPTDFACDISHAFIAGLLLEARAKLRFDFANLSEAVDDIETLFWLVKALQGGNTVLTSLVSDALATRAIAVVATGLATKQWTPEHRVRLENSLRSVDLLAGMIEAHRRNLTLSMSFTAAQMKEHVPSSNKTRWPLRMAPAGWWDQARAQLATIYAEEVIASLDRAQRRVDLSRINRAHARLGEIDPLNPYNVVFSSRDIGLIIDQLAAQPQLDLARTALALEDWRDTHGAYPPSLTDLPESSGVTHLRGLLDGHPFTYALLPDGTFTLKANHPEGHQEWTWPPATPVR